MAPHFKQISCDRTVAGRADQRAQGWHASTLSVVQGIRDMIPRVVQAVPPSLKITPLSDQSVFVRAAVSGVIREAVIAAAVPG